MSETQQNQPTGILGEIVEGMHNLEHKIDAVIHDAVAGDSSPSSTEPGSDHQWTPEQVAAILQAGGDAPLQINQISAGVGTATAGESETGSTEQTPTADQSASESQASSESTGAQASSSASSAENQSGSEPAGDAGNVSGAGIASLSSSTSDAGSSEQQPLAQEQGTGSAGGELGNESSAPTSSIAGAETLQTTSIGAAAGVEDPNVDASGAESAAVAASASSAASASPAAGTAELANSASLADRALKSIQKIRKHLWTFDRAAVADLHAELDSLESIFK